MADLSVTGGNTRVDLTKWKKLTPQEIIKEESKGEEIPSEIIEWAEQMAAFSKIPDNMTYEQVDGDTGIDALDKLGLEDTEVSKPEAANAQAPEDTEDPDAVKDPAKTESTQEDETDPQPGQAGDVKPNEEPDEVPDENELTLADSSITADDEAIRKRKERKGIQ